MAVGWFLYENILEDGTLTASEASGFPVENVIDWRVGTPYRWKFDATTSPASITLDLGSASSAQPDTFVLGGHNLYTAGAKYKVQYSTDGFATMTSDAFTFATPADDFAAQTTFTVGSSYRYWRIQIESTGANFTEAPQIGVATLGRRLALPNGITPDVDIYGEDPQTEWTMSEGGDHLGAVLRYVGKRFALSFPDPGFAVADFFDTSGVEFDTGLKPHLRTKPCWFAWNTDADSRGVWLVRRDGPVGNPFVYSTARRALTLTLIAKQEI